MTPERKKYLATISKEEQIIRKQLRFYHREIVGSKWDLNYYKDKGVTWMLISARENIHNHKVFIKALKKQLPQKMVYDDESKHWGWNCPVCRYRILNDLGFELDISRRNCPHCGQKLR